MKRKDNNIFNFIKLMYESYGVEVMCVEKNDISKEEELVKNEII
jgi:hypothetical protein